MNKKNKSSPKRSPKSSPKRSPNKKRKLSSDPWGKDLWLVLELTNKYVRGRRKEILIGVYLTYEEASQSVLNQEQLIESKLEIYNTIIDIPNKRIVPFKFDNTVSNFLGTGLFWNQEENQWENDTKTIIITPKNIIDKYREQYGKNQTKSPVSPTQILNTWYKLHPETISVYAQYDKDTLLELAQKGNLAAIDYLKQNGV